MKKIITVSGSAQHGKDTFAKYAAEYFEEYCQKSLIIHHADYLKYIAKQYMGWNGEKDEEGRHLLQQLGTEMVRDKISPTYWVDKTCDIIKICWDMYDYAFIPDTRFRNEIETLKSEFGEKVYCVHITRLDFNNCLTEEQRKHKSEIDLDGYPFDSYERVINDETMANAIENARNFVKYSPYYLY